MRDAQRPFNPWKDPEADAGESTAPKQLAGCRNPDLVCDRGAKFIKIYLKARREREWQFPAGLFSDPAWDILLELYVARSEDRQVSLSSACRAAAVPKTSGLRWLQTLESRRLVKRSNDMAEQGNIRVALAPDAIAGMNRWLDRMCPLPETSAGSG